MTGGNMATPTPEGGTPSILDRLEAHIAPEQEVEETAEDPAIQEDADEATPDEEAGEAEPEVDAPEDSETVDVSVIAASLGMEDEDVSVDDDGNLLIRTKVDGEEAWVKPADLRKSYQLEGHANKKSMEASELQKQLTSQQEKLQQEHQAKLKQAETVIALAAQELQGEFAKVNWDQLRLDDPQEWTAKQIEFQQRQQRLNQAFQQLQGERSQLTEAQKAQAKEYVASEQAALRKAVPDWADDEKFDTGKREVAAYLKSQGFSPDQITQVADHRAVLMARKAMLYDQLQAKKPAITKTVKKAPKLVKAGQTRSEQERSAEATKKLRKGLRTGSRGSVAALLEATGKV